MRRCTVGLAIVVLAAALAAPGSAENWDHPGLVHVEKLGWISRDDAIRKGCVEYRGRWVAKDLLKQLKTWEAEDAKHAGWGDAYKLKSKNYTIVSNVPRFILEMEIKPFLDELYDTYVIVFRRDFGVSSKAANQKTIRIHNGFADYSSNETDSAGPPPRSNPGFIVNGAELACFYDDNDAGNFYGTVFHEGAHQFMSAVFPAATLPKWLDEAMATYFEGCVYSRADKKIKVSNCPPDRLDFAMGVLRDASPAEGKSLAEELFMAVPDEKFDAIHYALSWSFIYYLISANGGRDREKFAKFLQRANGSGARAIAEVFERSTGMKLKEVEAGWKDFILAQKLEPVPWWVTLSLGGATPPPGCDVKDGDLIVSVDGIDVFNAEGFDRLWAARAVDRELELVLLRRTKCDGIVEYTEVRIVTRVPAGSELMLASDGEALRTFNLRE